MFFGVGAAIEPMPNVVELWQAEEGELLLPTQVRTAEVTGRLPGSGAGGGGEAPRPRPPRGAGARATLQDK